MKHIITTIAAIALTANTLTAQFREITIKDYLYGYFVPRTVRGIESMKDGESYTTFNGRMVIKYSYKTGETLDTVVDFWRINIPTNINGYSFSDDEGKILFYGNTSPLYRHSFFADYMVYDIANRRTTPLPGSQQRMASLSPDGKMAAYIVDNNIQVFDIDSHTTTQITTDGSTNHILNGVPDWVYEEEFGIDKCYEFSPDGKYLAYIKYDESDVKSYSLQYYSDMQEDYNPNANYPYIYEYKYPKVGEANSKVSVHGYEFATGKTSTADLGAETDIYVPKIQWTKQAGVLAISRLNRLQNRLDLLAYDTKTGSTRTFFTMQEPQYIEDNVVQSVTYLKDGKSFLIQSEQDGYRNIYRYGMDGKLINAVTSGDKEVTEYHGTDPDEKKVYFSAVGDNTTQIAVYSVDINGKNRRKLSTQNGTNSPQFSKNFKYYLNFFSNSQTPRTVTVCDNTGKTIRTVLDNNDLAKMLKSYYGGVNKRFFEWRNPNGDRLNAYMVLPPDFDSTKKYPVLVVGYNGPNSNYVNDEFEFNWHNLLAQKGVIVASTDTRGTGRKGEQFRKCTYGQLGNLETQDLADFNKYLASQPYIDGSRIGIWGWSYGGFMSLSLLTRAPGLYKLGIAIAPVTNWEYYDNIYTERYMGLPQQNVKGYKDNAPLKYAEQLEGKLFMAFGSADDNVHPQNAMVFAEALVQANKDFEMMQFTNKNHGIYGGNTTRYLYGKFIRFVLENL